MNRRKWKVTKKKVLLCCKSAFSLPERWYLKREKFTRHMENDAKSELIRRNEKFSQLNFFSAKLNQRVRVDHTSTLCSENEKKSTSIQEANTGWNLWKDVEEETVRISVENDILSFVVYIQIQLISANQFSSQTRSWFFQQNFDIELNDCSLCRNYRVEIGEYKRKGISIDDIEKITWEWVSPNKRGNQIQSIS